MMAGLSALERTPAGANTVPPSTRCAIAGCERPGFTTDDDGRLLCEECIADWAFAEIHQSKPQSSTAHVAGDRRRLAGHLARSGALGWF